MEELNAVQNEKLMDETIKHELERIKDLAPGSNEYKAAYECAAKFYEIRVKLMKILNSSKSDEIIKRAMPKASTTLSSAKLCREVSMEMNRIDDLIANPGIYYDDKAVEGFVKFCENELTLTDGGDLKLLDSFKLWAEEIFGWYYFVDRSIYVPNPGGHGGHYERKRIKKRLITKQYLIIPRGAAKTMYDAFIQSYFLTVDVSGSCCSAAAAASCSSSSLSNWVMVLPVSLRQQVEPIPTRRAAALRSLREHLPQRQKRFCSAMWFTSFQWFLSILKNALLMTWNASSVTPSTISHSPPKAK